jgi:competence protein ComEC
VRSGELLLVAFAMAYGAGFVLSPLLATTVALLAWLLLWGVTAAHVRLLALLLGLLTAWRAHRASESYLNERQQWISAAGAHAICSGEGSVAASPTSHRGKMVVVVDATSIDCEGQSTYEKARLRLVAEDRPLARGDRVQFVAELGPISLIENIGLRSPVSTATEAGVVASGGASTLEALAKSSGPAAAIDRARNYVRARISATFAPKAQALGRALVLGENDLDPEDNSAFRQSGLSHLLAVSGTHLVFAIVTWVTALRGLLLRVTPLSARYNVGRIVAPLGALTACLYADFAGGSGSAWRAAWMLTAMYTGQLMARRVNGVQALAISLLVGAAIDPWIGFDLSFLLSAAATSGLITLGQRFAALSRGIALAPLRAVTLAATTTVSAMLPCIPFLALMSPDITLAGVLANIVAGPLGEAASLPLCLVHAALSGWPVVERGLALCASGALLLVNLVAHATASLRWARVAVPYLSAAHFALLAIGVLAVCVTSGRRARLSVAAIALMCLLAVDVAARRQGRPLHKLRLTVNDVGQGDSLLVDFPDGRCMLIDGGGNITGGLDPGLTVLQPLFRVRHRKRVDVVVVTHPHPDHFGGLLTFLPTVDIGEVWMENGNLPELHAQLERRKVPIIDLERLCRTPRWFGAAEVRVLGPCPDASNASNTNNTSIVLRIQLGQRSILLPGDAEHESEEELVQRYGSQLKSDFLKVGHHGSRSSTSAPWLAAVQPTWAGISAGARNRFGHPAPYTVARLTGSGAFVLRTDVVGSIQWETDGTSMNLLTARETARGSVGSSILR